MDNESVKENFEILREIYNKIGDEKSKYIFNNRLLYSISERTEYIKNIVRCKIKLQKVVNTLNM